MLFHGTDIFFVKFKKGENCRPGIEYLVSTRWNEYVSETEENEYFLYRNKEALESWTKNGWTTKNSDSMLHVIETPETLTLVVSSDENSETYFLAQEIKKLYGKNQ